MIKNVITNTAHLDHFLSFVESYLYYFSLTSLVLAPCSFWSPQGSILGPLLYILFTADVESLLASCSLTSHTTPEEWYEKRFLLFGIASPLTLTCVLSHETSLAPFINYLRLSFLTGPGSGAPLSGYLEGALYKFHR